ncbi:low-density lipoprotein receptor-related protein 8-like [Ptychodera flava]|uniref:low-density lipoprotein receptor-related protein 8-like n=1 Tax=Ptychodera flava TaxID=63121 RepID=UPI00396A93F9
MYLFIFIYLFKETINGNGEIEVLIEQRVNTPDGVAVDWIYQNLYWTDTGTDTIEVAHLVPRHGAIQRAILINEGLDEPREIVVDPAEGFMYWTDWGRVAKIEKAGMNGCGRTTIIEEDVLWPNGLTMDYVGRRIFWVDGKLQLMASAGLDGGNRVNIMVSSFLLKHPFSLSVFLDHVYWTDWETEKVFRANKFTGGEKTVIAQNLYSPMGIVIYHSLKQMPSRNNCGDNNGKCSHICVAGPATSDCEAKYTCLCPRGVKMRDDGHTCNVKGITPHPDLITAEVTYTISVYLDSLLFENPGRKGVRFTLKCTVSSKNGGKQEIQCRPGDEDENSTDAIVFQYKCSGSSSGGKKKSKKERNRRDASQGRSIPKVSLKKVGTEMLQAAVTRDIPFVLRCRAKKPKSGSQEGEAAELSVGCSPSHFELPDGKKEKIRKARKGATYKCKSQSKRKRGRKADN